MDLFVYRIPIIVGQLNAKLFSFLFRASIKAGEKFNPPFEMRTSFFTKNYDNLSAYFQVVNSAC